MTKASNVGIMDSEAIGSMHGSLHLRVSGNQTRPVSVIKSASAKLSPAIRLHFAAS